MRFQIVKEIVHDLPQRVLRSGWEVTQIIEDYLDLQKTLFGVMLPDGEYVYTIMKLTLAGQGDDYTRAYMCIEENVPNGNHITHGEVKLTIEAAMHLAFEEN